ncbi:MAG: putative spermidine/putrescine transport system permease protein [Actinomycetota bacterium]|nr:putative spermidine/putrescine transport system permease protein [Actinomycetota bacterium]
MGALLGVLPFFSYATIFLVVPTLTVVVGSFLDGNNRPTLGNLTALAEPQIQSAFLHSVWLSTVTAVLGAVFGALLAYAVSTAREGGTLRRMVTSLCGVLAQFGGVTLAFAFVATVGFQGFVTLWLKQIGIDLAGSTWLFEPDKGLILVYTYFQIPLMLIVFLPAVEGLRPQWREAAESLGAGTWSYWRHVAGPILGPSFLGALLLLFANAFSAYATAAALISQGSPIIPLQIGGTLSSEVILGQENIGKAMALEMVAIVAVVMTAYAVLERRTTRWLGR